jgi:RNA polymerase sigma factor (sigma-70 family)
MTVTAAQIKPKAAPAAAGPSLDFEAVYRANAGIITSYFARRCREPQEVADLTSQTFVEAIRSAHTYRGRGTPRAWLIAIARAVYAQRCAESASGSELVGLLGGQLELGHDELDDLAARIDDQRERRALLARTQSLSQLEREAIELVDLTGLEPGEAARVLGVSANALRVRLFRAHSKLRKEMKP